MPLTQIDPVAALVVIDLQKGIVESPLAHPAQAVIANAARLAKAFRAARLPVVLVHVNAAARGRTDSKQTFKPSPEAVEIVPELDRQASDHVVIKQRWGAFLGTTLNDWLQSRGATQVILAGIATSIGVESTARDAHELGYNVVLVEDAMTDRDADAHRNSISKIFPRLGEVTNTAAVLDLVHQRHEMPVKP